MGMPEPQDPYGFWATVKDRSIDQLWPPDDEDVAYALADELFADAAILDKAAQGITAAMSRLPSAWPDAVGVKFQRVTTPLADNFRQIAESLRAFSQGVRQYGDSIREAKINIWVEIGINVGLYVALSYIPGGGFLASRLANLVAGRLTSMITGLAGRALTGLTEVSVEIGKEMLEEGFIAAATQAISMAVGSRQNFDLGQVGKNMVIGGVGGALGAGVSAAAKGAANVARKAGVNVPEMPNNMGANVLNSATKNAATSPSAAYIVENADDPAKLLDPSGYADAIAQGGLSAGLMAAPRTVAVQTAMANNQARYGLPPELLGKHGATVDTAGSADNTPPTDSAATPSAPGGAENTGTGNTDTENTGTQNTGDANNTNNANNTSDANDAGGANNAGGAGNLAGGPGSTPTGGDQGMGGPAGNTTTAQDTDVSVAGDGGQQTTDSPTGAGSGSGTGTSDDVSANDTSRDDQANDQSGTTGPGNDSVQPNDSRPGGQQPAQDTAVPGQQAPTGQHENQQADAGPGTDADGTQQATGTPAGTAPPAGGGVHAGGPVTGTANPGGPTNTTSANGNPGTGQMGTGQTNSGQTGNGAATGNPAAAANNAGAPPARTTVSAPPSATGQNTDGTKAPVVTPPNGDPTKKSQAEQTAATSDTGPNDTEPNDTETSDTEPNTTETSDAAGVAPENDETTDEQAGSTPEAPSRVVAGGALAASAAQTAEPTPADEPANKPAPSRTRIGPPPGTGPDVTLDGKNVIPAPSSPLDGMRPAPRGVRHAGTAKAMRGFRARPELGRDSAVTAQLANEAATEVAEAAGFVRIEADPDHPGLLRAVRADGSHVLFEVKSGPTSEGNPAEFTVENGIAGIVVSDSLLPSTPRWMWRVALKRAIGHELSEINQLLLGNDSPDVLVAGQPGARTGTSAHEHGRQTELRVLQEAHEQARGPLRVMRRMSLRHHMLLVAEDMRVHPTQSHSQQLKRVLAPDVEEIVDRHFPPGSRASWHRRLTPDPQADGRPSHMWFVGTALATGAAPGVGVGATIGIAANPVLGVAIGVSSVVTALANGLIGRWYSLKQKEAGDELKDYAEKELAREDALRTGQLFNPLLATMLGTKFVDPADAPQEPEVPGPRPTGAPRLLYRVASKLPSLLGPLVVTPMIAVGPFPDPHAAPGSGAVIEFSDRSLVGFWLTGLAVVGFSPLIEKFVRQRQMADELAQIERSLEKVAENKLDFLKSFVAEMHQIMRWIDTIDGIKSQPPRLEAPPLPPARDHGGGPTAVHFGVNATPGAAEQIIKAIVDVVHKLHGYEAIATLGVGGARSLVGALVGALLDRRFHVDEVRIIDALVDYEVEIDHAHGQQEQTELTRQLIERILPEIHAAANRRYGTPIPADPNKPTGAAERRQHLAGERAAAAARRLATAAAHAATVAQQAATIAQQAREVAEQAGLRPDVPADAQGRVLDEGERLLLDHAQRAADHAVRMAEAAAHAADQAARATGQPVPQQGPSPRELHQEQQLEPAHRRAAEAARAADEARLAANHLESLARQARTEAAQNAINAGKAAETATRVADGIAAHQAGNAHKPVGAPRNRALRRARVNARVTEQAARAAAERAANLTERAHVAGEHAELMAEQAAQAAEAAGVTDAHPDASSPPGSPTTTVVPATPPSPSLEPAEHPTRDRPPAFRSAPWFMLYGAIRNAVGWGAVWGAAQVVNTTFSAIVPGYVVAAIGVGSAIGAASWLVRWANRKESQRTDDLKEARKRADAWQNSAELQPELVEFYLDLFRKEIRIERDKVEPVTDPWFEPKRPPSLTPTHIGPSHPYFTEYIRFMHRLERAVLEREPRPYLLFKARLHGLARIRDQIAVIDELRAHAEATGDTRQLDQAVSDLDDTWFFYQRLVATTEGMPGPGLTPEKLAEERAKIPLNLGMPPRSPGALLPSMADALVASTAVADGRAYYGPDRADSLAAARDQAPRRSGETEYYTVHVAADRRGVHIGDRHYSIRQFATILRHDNRWRRQPVWVTDDRTGLSAAQLKELSEELGVPVIGDNTELGDLAAQGRATNAGTAFFTEEDDALLAQAREWPGRHGQHTVHVRYDLDGPYLGKRQLTEEEFRALLEHDPDRQDQPVAIAEQTEPLAQSRRTPGGRAYYAAEETASHAAAQAAPARDGVYTVHIRAGEPGVRIGDRWLSIAEFAEAVRRDPDWDGGRLVVTDDHTGLTTEQRAELSELLGVEVGSDHTEVADLFATTTATPGGRAAYPAEWAANHAAAQAAAPRDGYYTLHAVSGQNGIRIGDRWLTPGELAAVIAHDPDYRGQPVWLADAHTGLPAELRAELSRILGAEVRSDHAELADAFAESRATPGGRALYGADELAKHQAAQNAPRRKGFHTLHVEGVLDGVIIGGRRFTVDELAVLVREDPEWNGKPLWIADAVGLSPEAMARLSEMAGVRVEGETRFADAMAAAVPSHGGLSYPPAPHLPVEGDAFPVRVTVEADRFRIGHDEFTAGELGTLLALDPRYQGQPVVVVPSGDPLSDEAAERLAERLGAPVTVDNRFADAFADAIVVKDGVALYPPAETGRLATARANPDRPGYFTLHAVAGPDGVEIGGVTVPLAAVAEFVRRHPGWHGQPLWVTDPDTELTTEQRRELSAALGVEVNTPNGHLAEVLDAAATTPGHRAFPGTEAFGRTHDLVDPADPVDGEYVVHVVGDLDGVVIDGRRYTVEEFAELLAHRPDWRSERALRVAAEGIGLTAEARGRLEQALGHPVLTDSRLAQAWLASEPVPGGRLFSGDSTDTVPGHHVVRVRAELDSVVIGPVRFTIPELATLIARDPAAHGTPLWITGGPGLTPAALRQLSDLLGVPVHGDGRFTRAMGASTPVPSGRAFFGNADPGRHAAANGFPADPRRHVIHVEGHGDRIRIDDLWFSVHELAAMVRQDPAWRGQDVLVVADGVGLDMATLRELAGQLGVRVQPQTAPLAELLALGEATPAGRALHDQAELRDAARAVTPVPGHFVLDVLGDVDAVVAGGVRLDMRAVAALVANDPAWQGQALLVNARGLGLSQATLGELARHLAAAGVPVRATGSPVADALAARVPTPGGSSYYSADQAVSREAAQRTPRMPRHHVVHVITTQSGVRIGDHELTIAEFAALLRHDPAWRGQDVWVTDFLTGLSTGQAAELSALLGVAVRSDNTDVADVLAASRVVAGDRVLGRAEPTVAPEPGVYTLHAPGDLDAVVADGVRLAVDRIALLVRQDPLWDGASPVRVAGEIGLSPESRRELANLLGVPVLGESPVAAAFAASRAVPGGRSLLPGGAVLAAPAEHLHTLHVLGDGDRVWIGGRSFTMAELAALVRHDPAWGGKAILLAVAGPGLDAAAVAELGRLTGVPAEVAVLGHDPGDRFHASDDALPHDPLPMNLGTVHRVAEKYGIDLDGVSIGLELRSTAYVDAVTKADGAIHLYRGAFAHGDAHLAKVLRHEIHHTWLGRATTAHEHAAQEDDAYADEEAWWGAHPLNPEPTGPALTTPAAAEGAGAAPIPFSREILVAVAKKYGLDLSAVTVHLSLDPTGPDAAVTNAAGEIVVYRTAFAAGQEFLAVVLQQQLTHAARLRAGEPYPDTPAELAAWERAARVSAREWWQDHPRNPDPSFTDLIPSDLPAIPGHAVPGGRSYLPYGAQLAPPADDAHTVHVEPRAGGVEIDGVVRGAQEFAGMVRNDPDWRPGKRLRVVTPYLGTLDPGFIAELGRHLNVRIAPTAPAVVSHPDPGRPAKDPLPPTLDTARAVAAKYAVDLTGVELERSTWVGGPTEGEPDGRLTLFDSAYEYGEAYLARRLYGHRVYLDHVHAGTLPADPRGDSREAAAFRQDLADRVAEWWHFHPLNPVNAASEDPRPYVPSLPATRSAYRLEVTLDGNSVIGYGDLVRLDIAQLAAHVLHDPRWQGRTVQLTGRGALSPESVAELEQLLGVPVEVRTDTARSQATAETGIPVPAAEQVLAASHTVPGGRSLLPNGRTVLDPDPDHYTLHVAGAGDVIVFRGHRRTMAELAALLRLDPRWRPGMPIRLAVTGRGLYDETAAELAGHAGVDVVLKHAIPRELPERPVQPAVPRFDDELAPLPPKRQLPQELATVARVAEKYGIDLDLGSVDIRRGVTRVGDVLANGTIRLNVPAFGHGEQFLARVLFRAKLAAGMRDPRSAWRTPDDRETEFYALEAEWWAHHPLNPANATPVPHLPVLPSAPFVHRVQVVGDVDGVLAYGRLRLGIAELADLIRGDVRWDGRDVELVGPGGLSPESQAELARLLGVRVVVGNQITEALAHSHPVPGGRSFLDGGAQLVPGTASVHTIHVEYRGGRFTVGDRTLTPAEFAAVLKHDPEWRGQDLFLVTQGEAIGAEVAQQLLHRLDVPVTTMLDEPDPERTTHEPDHTAGENEKRATDPLPADMATVRRVAARYGIDLTHLKIKLTHAFITGGTESLTDDGTLYLSRKAFWHGEAGLARALYQGWAKRAATAVPGPPLIQALKENQTEATMRAAEWWRGHPLNPANLTGRPHLPSASAVATVYRLHMRADFDAVYVHGHHRVGIPELAERIKNAPLWAGREVSLTGGGALTPEHRALLEELLGVPVHVSVAAPAALAGSKAVPGGRSLLHGGKVLLAPRAGTHILHVEVADGQVAVPPYRFGAHGLAMIVRHDPVWGRKPVLLAVTRGRVAPELLETLHELLGVEVTQEFVHSHERGVEVEHAPAAAPPEVRPWLPAKDPLPVGVDTVRAVAEKYGINLGSTRFQVRTPAASAGRVLSFAEPDFFVNRSDGTVLLARAAFGHGEAFLARTVHEAWYRAEQLKVHGKPAKRSHEAADREAEVMQAGAAWWGSHPRNPDHRGTAPFIPAAPAPAQVYRLDARADVDGVLVYEKVRFTIPELVAYVRADPRWCGRTLQIGGTIGLDPVAQAELAEALGVEVIGPVGLVRAIAGRKVVPGGISLLPGGAQVARPVEGAFIVHAAVSDDHVLVDGTPVDAEGFAALIVNDPDYDGGPVVLATDDDPSAEFLEEVARRLPADLSLAMPEWADAADAGGGPQHHDPGRRARDPLPMSMATVERVAERYGIDISGIDYRLHRWVELSAFATTAPDGTTHLHRGAFGYGEEFLALVLHHERMHAQQPEPRSQQDVDDQEVEAHALTDRWWDGHPLNPHRGIRGLSVHPEPAPDSVYRLHLPVRGDGVLAYGNQRIDVHTLVTLIQNDPLWDGRVVELTGDGTLAPELRRVLERGLDVPVRVATDVTGALTRHGTPVPGGRSFLPDGRVLTAPVDGAHTIHVRVRAGEVTVAGYGYVPASVAEMVRQDSGYDGGPVVIATTGGTLDPAAVLEIGRHLGVPVTTTVATLQAPPAEPRLPVTPETVRRVALDFGVDLTGTAVEVHDERRVDAHGEPVLVTVSDSGVVHLYRDAFTGDDAALARAAYRGWILGEQFRSAGLPVTDAEANDTDAWTDAWWAGHPRNPDVTGPYLPPAPSDLHTHRLHVVGTGDGVYVYGGAPVGIWYSVEEIVEYLTADPRWAGQRLLITGPTGLSPEARARLEQALDVEVEVVTQAERTPADAALPATAESVRRVAGRYGVDLTGVDVDAVADLHRDAFARGEAALARALYRQWVNAEQVRIGQAYPGRFTEQEWLAIEGETRTDAWWDAHPLNPDRNPEPYLPTAPSDPDTYRLHVTGDFDGVFTYPGVRVSGDDLIFLIGLDPRWEGRRIEITGPVGISPALLAEIAALTGVEVVADTSAAEAFDASHAVPGGRSFLPRGKRLAFPAQGSYTVHIRHRDGRFPANGADHAPDALAAMVRHDPDWHGEPVVLATDTPLHESTVEELAERLGVPVTAVSTTGPTTAPPTTPPTTPAPEGPGTLARVVLPHEDGEPAGEPLPATVETVRAVAEEYGVDLTGTDVVLQEEQYLDDEGTPALGTIDEKGTIHLYPEAFRHGRAVLAVATYHELMNVEQLRTGRPFPDAPPDPQTAEPGKPRRPAPIHETAWLEIEAYQHESEWWDSHPLNPERAADEELDLPTAPSPDPAFFRVHLTGDLDGVYVYGRTRLTVDELIDHLALDFRRDGRPVLITGPVGLSPESKAAIEAALGVEVVVDTSAAEALAASHTVPSGQSFLEDGAELVPATDGVHTVHIGYQDGRFSANGTEHDPIAVAAMIRHHPNWRGRPVVIATGTPLDQSTVDELAKHLGVPVSAVTPDGLHYHEETPSAPDEQLPMTYDTVYDVADRYGVDLTGVPVVLVEEQVGGALAQTTPDGTLLVFPKAFTHGPAGLARALHHDWLHTEQLRLRGSFPKTAGEMAAWEDEAYEVSGLWWERHPLNPQNDHPFPVPAPVVSDPSVYRLHDVGDLDGVLLYGSQRVSITTLAMLIRSDPVWGGREILFTGPNGLSAESQEKLARLLGVPVTVDTSVADALAARHPVPGGTSFLADGRQLLLPVQGVHTVHVDVRGDRFLVGGAYFTPAAFATMLRHDPGRGGAPVVIATDTEPLGAEVAEEIGKALGVPVTTAWVNTAHETPILLDGPQPLPAPGEPLPVDMETVRRVAAKYGVDLTGVHIGVESWRDMRGQYAGASLPGNPASTRGPAEFLDAFRHGEAALAQVLYHAWLTNEQVRIGMPAPDTRRGAEWREAEVVARVQGWWAAHPLNPANETFGPYVPTAPAGPRVHRIHVVAEVDRVVLFGSVRVTMAELAELIRQDPTWEGRTLRITGPGILTDAARATLEQLLDAPVEVHTHLVDGEPQSPEAAARPGQRTSPVFNFLPDADDDDDDDDDDEDDDDEDDGEEDDKPRKIRRS